MPLQSQYRFRNLADLSHMKSTRLLLLLVLAVLVAAFFVFDLHQYFNLEYLKSQQSRLDTFYQANSIKTVLIFFFAYIAIAALSLPGGAIMTLAGGAIFGFSTGLLLVSFASTMGATLAFLIVRFLFNEPVQKRFSKQLQRINTGIKKDGVFYLFTIRMIPLFPFFIVNMVMALTPIKVWTFAWVSQIGMLAVTAVLVNAGTQLAKIRSLGDILSPGLIGSLVLVGFASLIAKLVVSIISKKRIYADHPMPKSFDTNLIVIGGGSAGLVSAYIAAQVKAKVVLIEQAKMGGDCLNSGCVPSKSLIAAARVAHQFRNADRYGVEPAEPVIHLSKVMQRVHESIEKIAPHDSVERYTSLGVDCITGSARLTSPFSVEVDGKTITAPNIILATGAEPFVPPIQGVEDSGYVTSDTIWDVSELPKRLVVMGGGSIGCELAQSFARLGSKVTIVEMMPHLMANEDADMIEKYVSPVFEADGIDIKTDHKAVRFERDGGNKTLVTVHNEQEVPLVYDMVLIAVGRRARTQGFGLAEVGIRLTERKTIEVNEYLQTNYPNIYACGDVIGSYQFTHTAAHEAYYASTNALFRGVKKTRVDYSVIPWCTFTEPEVARVGLSETDAKKAAIEFESTVYNLNGLDRAITEKVNHGIVRVLTPPGKDKVLGATIIGHNAGEMIAEFVMAMQHGIGLKKLLGTICAYPTMMGANKYVAGEWRRAHAPVFALKILEKYHHWKRK